MPKNKINISHSNKSKGLPRQAEVAQGVPGRLRSRIFLTFWHYKGGRSSAKRTGRIYPRRNPRGLCVRIAGCCSILQTGHINLSSTPDQQLENHSTKYHRQQPLYNTLELLMMGLVVPETC